MQVFRGLEQWGREKALRLLVRTFPTAMVSAIDVGQALGKNPAPKILLVGIYQHMGQFLCATPLVRALAKAWPEASLHFLGNPVNATAARANPHLARVWVWNKTGLTEWPVQLQALRREHFDVALLLTTERPSATGVALARFTGARCVAAYVPTVDGEWAKDAATLCHLHIPMPPEKNEVEKFLGFARAFGVPTQGREPEFRTSPADDAAAGTFLSGLPVTSTGPRVGLFVGGKSERADRLWPVSHWARLAKLLEEAGLRVIALSPPPPVNAATDTYLSDEHLRVSQFLNLMTPPCPVYQESSIGRVAAFLKTLDLLICPDGGILHLAASVGTPALGLFFSTDPYVWRHEATQTVIDGRGKPSSALFPDVVAEEALRLLATRARS